MFGILGTPLYNSKQTIQVFPNKLGKSGENVRGVFVLTEARGHVIW